MRQLSGQGDGQIRHGARLAQRGPAALEQVGAGGPARPEAGRAPGARARVHRARRLVRRRAVGRVARAPPGAAKGFKVFKGSRVFLHLGVSGVFRCTWGFRDSQVFSQIFRFSM